MPADKTISDGQPFRHGFTLGQGTADSPGTARASSGGVIGRRIFAFAIDMAILSLIWVAGWMLIIGSLGTLFPLIMLALTVLPVLYSTALIASEGAATLGMRAMGLRVLGIANGERPGLAQSFIMAALFYLTLFATSGLLLIWCLFDDNQRCLHDILANTRVQRG